MNNSSELQRMDLEVNTIHMQPLQCLAIFNRGSLRLVRYVVISAEVDFGFVVIQWGQE